MNSNAKRTAFITGASSGIGKAFAEHFAHSGWDVVITARRQDRLDMLSEDLEKRYGTKVTVIAADLADPESPKTIYNEIQSKGIHIDGLVNNAGYGIPQYFVNTDWEKHRDFIQVLVTSVTYFCHLFLPRMIENRYGRIINVSSLNGLIPCSPGQSLYASAKSFVVSLSHTLQAEATDKGVHVCALCPGFTYSEFHDVTGTRELVDKIPKRQWLRAEDVAKLGFDAVMNGKPLCVTGRSSKINYALTKFLPRSMIIDIMKKRSKKFRKIET
ncbi:SDR family oxidoreductase [uncultured Desulfosarcina sp.]|uniref:SDR family NAD(P)-dependent oxidoreductase n=1 Tax=uncultured Desulfosarcina sp. TaxID=218289 RepID=UPI0029C66E20|nr:SDR family oxidoreductase [uncultured Desulfosarcina sp.]